MTSSAPPFAIRNATPEDVPLLLSLIRELAEYEKLANEAVATAGDVHDALFGPDRVAYAVIATSGGEVAGFALYFFNFSTFVGRPGLYLEDLFVRPAFRKRGIGRGLLAHLAKIAVERRCGRMEWSVLDWNETALTVYRAIGAREMTSWRLMRLTGSPLTVLASDAPAAPTSSVP